MKHIPSADKLIDEMTKLVMVIIHDKGNKGEPSEEMILMTGNVLGALEVFTFANFNDAEQEVIFSRAHARIEPDEALTQR
jgi:hypothetical protein